MRVRAGSDKATRVGGGGEVVIRTSASAWTEAQETGVREKERAASAEASVVERAHG